VFAGHVHVPGQYGTLFSVFRLLFLLCLISSLVPAQPPTASSPEAFFRSTFETMLRLDPEFATSSGFHQYDDRWTDWSKAAREQRKRFVLDTLASADRFPQASLSPEDALTMRLIQYDSGFMPMRRSSKHTSSALGSCSGSTIASTL
jgi:uncharacterized protein (DUF885 family)